MVRTWVIVSDNLGQLKHGLILLGPMLVGFDPPRVLIRPWLGVIQ